MNLKGKEDEFMGERVKKEHYVPRTYLRSFATNNKFFVFDKEKAEVRPGSIEDYACERYFYDVDFDSIKQDQKENSSLYEYPEEVDEALKEIDEQHIEHFYGNIVETTLFKPIKTIITQFVMCNPARLGQLPVLSEREMDDLSLYISIQILRTKEFREAMSEIYTKLPMHLMKKMAKTEKEKRLYDSFELEFKNENYKKLQHATYLVNPDTAADLAEPIRDKIWIIGYCRGGKQFYTSDNPVVKNAHGERSGLSSRGIEIAFPITKHLILIMRDKEFFSKDRDLHNRFLEVDNSFAEYVNSLQVIHSYRYVFSNSSDFALAEKMINDYPELRKINRNRFQFG